MTTVSTRRRVAPRTTSRSQGFTLTEILVTTTILGFAASITMVVFLAALKRANHTEAGLKGTAELRYATDVISQAVRSSSLLPTVADGGRTLLVPPRDLGFATVEDGTWIDQPQGIQGWKDNQRVLKVSDVTGSAVTQSIWKTTTRPSGAIAATDVPTLFIGTSSLPKQDIRTMFSVGDTLTVPATSFGPSVDRVINSISNNAGTKTISLTADLGVNVPNGTKILATSGRRLKFTVTAGTASDPLSGELRFYPDSNDATKYTVLARHISPAPLSDPAQPSSSAGVPFTIPTASSNYVIINLQKVPPGTSVGRTLQGVQSTVFTRNDPLNQ